MSYETFFYVLFFSVAGFLLGHGFGYNRTPPKKDHNIKAQAKKE